MEELQVFIKRHYNIIVIAIVLIAAILRIVGLGQIPAYYQWDEASSAYESFNLVEEGTDRWGNKYPVYFLGWGSGQNVLLAYAAMPFIKIFGLSPIAIRLPMLIVGILTVIVTFLLAKKLFGKKVGLITLILMTFLPWNFMMSRWGLESNMLPFFVVLGVYLLYLSKENKKLIIFSLIPFAIALYAYAVFAFVLPFILIGYFYFERDLIKKHWKHWLGALAIWFVIALPFILFFIKNYITKSDFSFESFLPFSIVKLPVSRTEQLMNGEFPYYIVLLLSLATILSGFVDMLNWNSIQAFPPLSILAIPFVTYGLVILFRNRHVYSKQLQALLPWSIALIPLYFLFPVNLNRGNFVLPVFTILIAVGISRLFDTYKNSLVRTSIIFATSVYLVLTTLGFFTYYFVQYEKDSARTFQKGFDSAFEIAKKESGDKKLYITKMIPINYLFPLVHEKVTASELKLNGSYHLNGADVKVVSYKNYFFDLDSKKDVMNEGDEFVMLAKTSDWIDDDCQKGTLKIPYEDQYWKIVVCNAKFRN